MADRIVVAMTGATGQVYGVRALEFLTESTTDVHLILSDASKTNLTHEGYDIGNVTNLADEVHSYKNYGAKPASGSFRTDGMIVVPCSMKTLSNIAHGNSQNLISRAADVTLKERRPLVVMPREKPFNRVHLQNMLTVTEAGAIVIPPLLSFYQHDELDAMISRTMARSLSHLGVEVDYEEWNGI